MDTKQDELDPRQLLGYRLLSEDEIAVAKQSSAMAAKIGNKGGTKVGFKPA